MPEQFQAAQTIPEVIARLDAIIQQSIEEKSAMGIFPALYVVVTEKIKESIDAGNVFKDNKRLERLDVIFANRFLEAHHQYIHGQKPTLAWQAAFKAAENFPSYIILQELLLGTNAHINLDLGIASAETAPGAEIKDLRDDFNRVNEILEKLTGLVRAEISDLSPRIGLIDSWMKGADDAIMNFSIRKARDWAWKLAEDLAPLPPEAWPATIQKRDQWVYDFAQGIRAKNFIGQIIVWWIKWKESKDLPKIIEGLRNAAGRAALKM